MIILLFALCWRDIHLLLNAWRSAISIPCAISCPTLNVRSCATSPELQDACKQGFIQVQKLTFDHYNLAILVKHRVDQTTLICNFHFFTSSWYKMATQWGWGGIHVFLLLLLRARQLMLWKHLNQRLIVQP